MLFATLAKRIKCTYRMMAYLGNIFSCHKRVLYKVLRFNNYCYFRCLYFPWMIAMSMEVLLMVGVGLWYIVRYYRNVSRHPYAQGALRCRNTNFKYRKSYSFVGRVALNQHPLKSHFIQLCLLNSYLNQTIATVQKRLNYANNMYDLW